MAKRYSLSPKHAFAAKPDEGLGDSAKLRWREDDLSAALVLNPALLEVEGQLPVGLDGGTTSSCPDLLFADELGRLTIVELKKTTAKVPALVQLLGYGLNWGLLPNGHADGSIRENTSEQMGERIVVREVQNLVKLLGLPVSKVPRLVEATFARLLPAWPWANSGAAGVRDAATKLFGPGALSFVGAPPRLILAAPGFDDGCAALAEQLAGRAVNIQFWRADLQAGGKPPGLVLDWELVLGKPHMDRCWDAVRAAWKMPYVREHFLLNAWTDRSARDAVCLASKEAPAARIWLDAKDAGQLSVSTCVPHGWHTRTDPRRRDQITNALRAAMGGALSQEFAAGEDQAKVGAGIELVARALVEQAVPHQPVCVV